MPLEIERKFLVDANQITQLSLPSGKVICQGYIATQDKTAVRIRIQGPQAFLTLKGANTGATRVEFEYPIPVADAKSMLDQLCSGPIIEKTRYCIPFAQHTWELDIFHGDNQGLIVAEVELTDENESITLPPWVIEEVTGDPKYYNVNLLAAPYCSW